MTLTPEQKEEVVDLLEMGDKLKAVRYLKETLYISLEQALALAEKLEAELEAPAPEEGAEEFKGPSGINVGRLVGSIFMVIGFIMLAVAAYLVYSHYKFEQIAQPVESKVIHYDSYQSRNKDNSHTTMYTPTFEYTFKGKPYQYKSSMSSSSQDYQIDEVVVVLVDPQDPQNPQINSFWEKWFLPILLGFMGTLFGGLGFLAYRFLGRRE